MLFIIESVGILKMHFYPCKKCSYRYALRLLDSRMFFDIVSAVENKKDTIISIPIK